MIRINLILHSFVKWSVTLVIKMHDVDNVNQLIPQNFIEVDPTKASIIDLDGRRFNKHSCHVDFEFALRIF